MKNNESLSGSLGVLIAAAMWGTTGTAATFAPNVSPIAIGSAAMGIGGILQALLAANLIYAFRSMIFMQSKPLLVGSVAIGIYPLAFYSSMKLIGVAAGTVITIGFAPLASALLEWIVDKKKLTMKWVVGATAGKKGTTLLCIAKSGHQHQAALTDVSNDILGTFLGLMAACTYALYSHTAHKLMQKGIAGRAVMGTLFGLGGIILFPVLLYTGAPFLESWSNAAVGIYMASVPMFLGYFFFGYGLERIPASKATTISLFEPAVATLLAVFILGEHLPALAWHGIALIVICLFVLIYPGWEKRDSQVQALK
ncbi:MAG: DMT family transporter [Desulfobacterales bacterium]|nr:DMT family transporter [Desulfobacterales bacterium]